MSSLSVGELSISGAWVFTPTQHPDDRGSFCEWFRADVLSEAVGRPFEIVQANSAYSRQGVLRGIHGVAVPPGQAKLVTCLVGCVLDVVVDVRTGSPTFGQWDSVQLDDVDRRAVYLAEGLGHGFMTLSQSATVTYLCNAPWTPEHEFEISALDPELNIAWPSELVPVLSDKDRKAPNLRAAARSGSLPQWKDFSGRASR